VGEGAGAAWIRRRSSRLSPPFAAGFPASIPSSASYSYGSSYRVSNRTKEACFCYSVPRFGQAAGDFEFGAVTFLGASM